MQRTLRLISAVSVYVKDNINSLLLIDTWEFRMVKLFYVKYCGCYYQPLIFAVLRSTHIVLSHHSIMQYFRIAHLLINYPISSSIVVCTYYNIELSQIKYKFN